MTHPANVRNNQNKDTGYRCPICNEFSSVIDSRPSTHGWRRRRSCLNGHRLTTYETTIEAGKDFLAEIWRAKQMLAQANEILAGLDNLLTTAQHRGEMMREYETSRYGNAANPASQNGAELRLVAQDGETYPAGTDDAPEILAAYGFPMACGKD